MSYNQFIVKQTTVSLYHGTLSQSKRKGNVPLSIPKTTWVDLEDIKLSEKKSHSKGHILYDSTYAKLSNKKITEEDRLVVARCWGQREVWAGQWIGPGKGEQKGSSVGEPQFYFMIAAVVI